jgi:integrase
MTSDLDRKRRTPPEPTSADPYAQLDWLGERYARRYAREASRRNIRNIVRAYKKFLTEEVGYDERLAKDSRYYLAVHCDPFALYNADLYWRSMGCSTHTRSAWVRGLRKLFEYAAAEKLTPTTIFIIPRWDKTKRETLQREAYEVEELKLIWDTFNPHFQYTRRVAAGYKPTGIGSDPRRGKSNTQRHSLTGQSTNRNPIRWSWENFIWYFENEMNCQPVVASKDSIHQRFFSAASDHYGSVKEVWRRLGVTPIIDVNLILPLAMKLCWETGLNTGALLALKRDCLQEAHPLTNQPFIQYYKERSTGEKHLHLHLLDAQEQTQLHLSHKQSSVVRGTIELILKLTAPLVDRAEAGNKDFLFIYQTAKRANGRPSGSVVQLTAQNISTWAKPLLRRLKNEGYKHVPTYLNLARFRPSRLTQMVREGKDFFDIQAVAGHAYVHTTLAYLSAKQVNPLARREVTTILQRIHENKEEFESNPKPYATAKTQSAEGIVYKGVLSDCKNVYDPPPIVRRLPVYREGQACTYFNMCLTCPNVLITKKHLPMLLRYKREIEQAIANSNLTNVPNSALYEKDLAVLDGIMLEFDKADIAWAQEIAECADEHIDHVTYRGIDES